MDIWRQYKSPETRLLRHVSHLQESRLNHNNSNIVPPLSSSTSRQSRKLSIFRRKKRYTLEAEVSKFEKADEVCETAECGGSSVGGEGSTSAESTVNNDPISIARNGAGALDGSREDIISLMITEEQSRILRESHLLSMDVRSRNRTVSNKFNSTLAAEYIHNGSDSKTDKLKVLNDGPMHQGSAREMALANITNYSERNLSDQELCEVHQIFGVDSNKLHETEDNPAEFSCRPLFNYDYGSSDPLTTGQSWQPSIEELLEMFPKLTRSDLEDDLASDFLFPLSHVHYSILQGKQIQCERCRQSIEYLMTTYDKYIALFANGTESWQTKRWGQQIPSCATDNREVAAQMARAECRIALVYP
ncbi:hypothetical protein LIPSTDRAFT_69642 [Lipomyces starkeyi NRRL Y-11557]|uniref:Uncharacterized protein n=1 Tax=Lipomyces starkeyi NRRL Y-11557 TaxID=675824 RepID=A0A1E3Q8Q6_LIPST|nr:hypothetical protein LIPSTDRAFT_69642 [Lipomyces starkeyi NRRL Y-11557]